MVDNRTCHRTIKRYRGPLVLFAVWLCSCTAHARLTIEITGGSEASLPIAVVPFGWEGTESRPPLDLASVISADLYRSGRFSVLPPGDRLATPTQAEEVNLRNWQALGQEALLIGRMQDVGRGQYSIQFQLYDVFKGEVLASYSIESSRPELRHSAHRISDIVYEKLTGDAGAFSTRIAYVSVQDGGESQRRYAIEIADADGYNPQAIVESEEPILSLAWSPDGKKLAYVSFESKQPAVFVQTLGSGRREKVAEFTGINGAPAWSPDGRQLALTLSKDGSPDIYILNPITRSLRRLTHGSSIDTEPAWSRDGQTIVFTSNRGGRAQLYSIPVHGGKAKRVTFAGDYNAHAAFSPDGKQLAMVHGTGGDYRIAVMDLKTRDLRVLTKGKHDESPSFAPNGSMIVYATQRDRRSQLSAVSADGRVHQHLALDGDETREPVWSPR